MKILSLLLLSFCARHVHDPEAQNKALKAAPAFDIRIIADRLSDPWEITCGTNPYSGRVK